MSRRPSSFAGVRTLIPAISTATVSLFILLVAAASAPAQQDPGPKNPYRNYTQEKFVQNMQTAGRNYAAVADLVSKKDYESAKAQLTRAREQLAITITFWRDNKKGDAVELLREALRGSDALDDALSQESVDASAVAGASQRLNAACQACHAVYRIQDPITKAYRIKLSSSH